MLHSFFIENERERKLELEDYGSKDEQIVCVCPHDAEMKENI